MIKEISANAAERDLVLIEEIRKMNHLLRQVVDNPDKSIKQQDDDEN
jgi:hypothetical protein